MRNTSDVPWKESVWRADSAKRRLPRLSRPVRIGIVLVVGVVLVVVAFVLRDYSVSKPVELEAIADPGLTRIRLGGHELRPMSPGCGCLDPSFGAHKWFGVNLPSTGFEMTLSSKPNEQSAGKLWGLTAMSPELAPIDWLESPNHTIQMRVVAGRRHQRVLFEGRTTYALVLGEHKVHVSYGRRFPYAALLPAANGPVDLESEPYSRPDFGSVMRITATAPARAPLPDESSIKTEREYRAHTDLTQRGPMIDVLGPVIHLSTSSSDNLHLFAGYKPLPSVPAGEPVSITLRTPYAIRLFPQPASRSWSHALPGYWQQMLRQARKGNKAAEAASRYGPTSVGRFIDEDASPEYSVHLQNVSVPPQGRWRRFAYRSAHHNEVKQMLSNSKADLDFWTIYDLPPVERDVEVGVFGPLVELRSSAMHGDVLTDGKDVPFGRGQQLSIDSEDGLTTGRFQMTPLVSAGPPTGQANAAGNAKVSIDGDPVNTFPFLPIILGAIALVAISLATEAFVLWGIKSP